MVNTSICKRYFICCSIILHEDRKILGTIQLTVFAVVAEFADAGIVVPGAGFGEDTVDMEELAGAVKFTVPAEEAFFEEAVIEIDLDPFPRGVGGEFIDTFEDGTVFVAHDLFQGGKVGLLVVTVDCNQEQQ